MLPTAIGPSMRTVPKLMEEKTHAICTADNGNSCCCFSVEAKEDGKEVSNINTKL